jgi:hypothetical protein
VLGVPAPFTVSSPTQADHMTVYTYDTHVPLAFYGLPFQPGTYHTHSEPVDLAVTLASLLGINSPTHAVGRVLIEALASGRRAENSSRPPDGKRLRSPNSSDPVRPVSAVARGGSW